jgi:glycosyltransferase involved in cell wall biosynthesis
MKITVTVQFHNELEFLEGWFASASRYADEIICASHNATDGSLEFFQEKAKSFPITILEFPEDTVAKYGFSYMKNSLITCATGDWIVCLDADEEMDIDKATFPTIVRGAAALATQTMHISDTEPHWSLSNRQQIRDEAKWQEQRHWRIFKNGHGIKWHGLIHESLRWPSGVHVALTSKRTAIKMYHFGALANPAKRTFKDGLYAELLLRAYENRSLRDGTDKWWFENFVPNNITKLKEDRDAFQSISS